MWGLAEAKNKFSEVFTKAISEGPQRVKRRDETVVILSEADFESLSGRKKTLGEFLLSQPKVDFDFELERDRSTEMREIDFD